MKLLTLAQKLDFTTETEYFDYCIDSYINGQITQAKSLFNNMGKNDKKELLKYISSFFSTNSEIYNFFLNRI